MRVSYDLLINLACIKNRWGGCGGISNILNKRAVCNLTLITNKRVLDKVGVCNLTGVTLLSNNLAWELFLNPESLFYSVGA